MMEYVLYMLALVNLIAIAVLIYKRKKNWIAPLAILEIVLVYLSLTL